jgi:hypothetical protein
MPHKLEDGAEKLERVEAEYERVKAILSCSTFQYPGGTHFVSGYCINLLRRGRFCSRICITLINICVPEGATHGQEENLC